MNKSLPNLFIPGAGKSGTSTLHELLNHHPDICMSSVKEPHYWTKLEFDSYSEEDRLNYLNLFNAKPDTTYNGESSTGYMQFPNFIKRIKDNYTEEPRFIFVLRNPIDRCYSHYWWLKGIGSEKKQFIPAVLDDYDIEPTHKTKLPEANYKSYFQYGLYGKWLKRFYTNFEKSNIKIITFEDLKTKRIETINSCFEFLDLKTLDQIPEVHTNKTQILKYPLLYKYAKLITWNQIYLPQFVKDAMPSKLKMFIRKNLMKNVLKYTSTNKTYPEISQSDRLFLKERYLEDVNELRMITGLKFENWTDFNN